MPAAIIDVMSKRNLTKFVEDLSKDFDSGDDARTWFAWFQELYFQIVDDKFPPEYMLQTTA